VHLLQNLDSEDQTVNRHPKTSSSPPSTLWTPHFFLSKIRITAVPSIVELLENLLGNLDSDYQIVNGRVSNRQRVNIGRSIGIRRHYQPRRLIFQHHYFFPFKTCYLLHWSRPCNSSRNLKRHLVPLEVHLDRLTTLKSNSQVTNKTLSTPSRLAFAFIRLSVA
jgi:hypothetical protein